MLFLSLHAVRRMEQRGISRAEVLEALSERETVYASAGDDSSVVICGRTATGRRLKIVVNAEDHEHVITAMVRGEDD